MIELPPDIWIAIIFGAMAYAAWVEGKQGARWLWLHGLLPLVHGVKEIFGQ